MPSGAAPCRAAPIRANVRRRPAARGNRSGAGRLALPGFPGVRRGGDRAPGIRPGAERAVSDPEGRRAARRSLGLMALRDERPRSSFVSETRFVRDCFAHPEHYGTRDGTRNDSDHRSDLHRIRRAVEPLGFQDPHPRAGTRARAHQQGDARSLRRARNRCEEPFLEHGRRAGRPGASQGRARRIDP